MEKKRTIKFRGIQFPRLENPVDAQVKPEAVRVLRVSTPSGKISILGYRQQDEKILFAAPGSQKPIDQCCMVHLLNREEVQEELSTS